MPRLNVLFLCTGNASRSIMAEAILDDKGFPTFRVFSAGSRPRGAVHPNAIRQLRRKRLSVGRLRSKSWTEFTGPGAPPMDIVITLCDDAAKETCPIWAGHPITAHWGLPDPGNVDPHQVEQAFAEVFATLERRISLLIALPLASLDATALKSELARIGRS